MLWYERRARKKERDCENRFVVERLITVFGENVGRGSFLDLTNDK